MPVQNLKYCEYFDVNEKYFPCIDESAINSGAAWDTTYPHQTFIDLLNRTEKMLSGNTNRSIWIHGAYGTGKSQCAYTLKKLLEVPETKVRNYWNKFEPLKKNPVLLEKLIGHKAQGIVTAYRYASGSISTPQQLFFAVQESIKKALDVHEVSYKGENSLKESVISWLEDPIHNQFIDALLQKPKWMSTFSQSSADEIINTLKKSSDVSSLMDDIFSLAAEEGITALNLSADSLRKWIIDIIDKNNIKLVLIWDEFSDYFRQNSTSLGEFQKIVSICQEKPFYFVIVTHPLSSLAKEYDSSDKTNPWSVVQQRFDKVEITLPDNIAFELIGHAFSVKPAAKANWKQMTEDLNSDVTNARKAVIKAANINDQNVMRDILPIHPIAALVLKNIASAFQSNQRSMFDFIKTPKDMDVNAFQWFIQNTSPLSDRPFLTVDMLWDFFYEKGKDYLSSDIRLILDTFQQQAQLYDKEKIVLKTVLIMQSIDQRLGGALPILKPTDQNLSYAFEGDTDELENSCKSIAKALVNKGILIENPIANGKKVYSAAVLAGDGAKIEAFKKEIREKQGTTAKLVSEGAAVATALSLPPALKLRYALELDSGKLPVVTMSDFKKVMNVLKSKDVDWHFYAVLALAKTDEEAQSFRTLIKKTIADPVYKNIAVIDALSTPLGLEAFEQYVDYSAMSMYYSGNNGQQSKENAKKAKDVLERDWKDRIHDGQFIVFTYERFENGKLLNVAEEINAEDSVLSDIKKLFNVQYSALWIGSTGEDEIRKLITEYEVVKSTNIFLNVTVRSKEAAFKTWRETLKFIGFSCESIKAKKPALDKFFYNLLRIANYEDMLPDNMKSFLDEMTNHNAEIRDVLGNTLAVFIDIYAPYLEGFTDTECEEIKNSITSEMFTISSTASNAIVKKAAEDYRKNQVKSQLYKLWSDKSGGSKNPRVWSEKYRTPILCCVNDSLYAEAKKAFATLNSNTQSEADIKEALAFIKEADFFDEIASADYRDKCFAKRIIGDYTSLISDIDAVRDTLESTGISAYEWNDNPTIMSKVSSMAAAEYNAGGSDKVVDIIEGMNDAELKKWLTDIVRKDMGLGVKIIINREG